MSHQNTDQITPGTTVQSALDQYCKTKDKSVLSAALSAIINGHNFDGDEMYILLLTAEDIVSQRAAKKAGS